QRSPDLRPQGSQLLAEHPWPQADPRQGLGAGVAVGQGGREAARPGRRLEGRPRHFPRVARAPGVRGAGGWMITLQAAVTGALIGGLYAVMAAGLSVTWGVLRVINLAHFGLILLGAYLTYQLATSWGLDPILTLAVTVPALFVLGGALQWAYDRLRIVEFNSLLVSFGLLIITIQLATDAWSADFRRMSPDDNPYATGSIRLGSLAIPTATLLAFAAAVLFVGGGHLLLQRTF